jgi:hypothetical protein
VYGQDGQHKSSSLWTYTHRNCASHSSENCSFYGVLLSCGEVGYAAKSIARTLSYQLNKNTGESIESLGSRRSSSGRMTESFTFIQ